MVIIVIFVLLAIVIFASQGEVGRASVVVCNSYSCSWNKLCRCTRREIAIYDNTVKGLCLHHTEDMEKRIINPLQEKRLIRRSGLSSEVMGKSMKLREEKLLKDPNAFAKWMGKTIRKKM